MNVTTEYPIATGDTKKDLDTLYQWAVGFLDELKYIISNLDASNVLEAATVKAEHINTNHAKIKDAQIKSLTADKLTAGTIDCQEIQVVHMNANNIDTGTLTVSDSVMIANENETLQMDGDAIIMKDNNGNERIVMGQGEHGYLFAVWNSDKTEGIYMEDSGNLTFSGNLNTGKDAVIGKNLTMNGDTWSSITWKQKNTGEIAVITVDALTSAVTIMTDGAIHLQGRKGVYANNVRLDE